jgi:hypothetical protein
MTTSIPKKALRGNALDAGLRLWLLGHRSDDLGDQGIPQVEIEEEQQQLAAMNNTQFRAAFISFYGKDWWENVMSWQRQKHF